MADTLQIRSSAKTQLAFENAQKFTLAAHYTSFQPYLEKWGEKNAS
jgi:hypothetical protein